MCHENSGPIDRSVSAQGLAVSIIDDQLVVVHETSPTTTASAEPKLDEQTKEEEKRTAPTRRKLPDERVAITHKFSVEGQEGYITVGQYNDGRPGELFITMAKEGSTLSGVLDAFGTAISLLLQYGVPLVELVNRFSHVRFEPSGWTNHPQISYAKSIIDYIFRWMAIRFLAPEEQAAVGVQPLLNQKNTSTELQQTFVNQVDAPPCPTCGFVMVRNGACYKCMNCGTIYGCS